MVNEVRARDVFQRGKPAPPRDSKLAAGVSAPARLAPTLLAGSSLALEHQDPFPGKRKERGGSPEGDHASGGRSKQIRLEILDSNTAVTVVRDESGAGAAEVIPCEQVYAPELDGRFPVRSPTEPHLVHARYADPADPTRCAQDVVISRVEVTDDVDLSAFSMSPQRARDFVAGAISAELGCTLRGVLPPSSSRVAVKRLESKDCHADEQDSLPGQYGVVLEAPGDPVVMVFAGSRATSGTERGDYREALGPRPQDPIDIYAARLRVGFRDITWMPFGGGNAAQYMNSSFKPGERAGVLVGDSDRTNTVMVPFEVRFRKQGRTLHEHMYALVQTRPAKNGEQLRVDYGPDYVLRKDESAAQPASRQRDMKVKDEPVPALAGDAAPFEGLDSLVEAAGMLGPEPASRDEAQARIDRSGRLKKLLEVGSHELIEILKRELNTPDDRMAHNHRKFLVDLRKAMCDLNVSPDQAIRSAQLQIVEEVGADLSKRSDSIALRFFRVAYGWKLLKSNPAFMAALVCGLGRAKYGEVLTPPRVATNEAVRAPALDEILLILGRPEDADIRARFVSAFPESQAGSSSSSSASSSSAEHGPVLVSPIEARAKRRSLKQELESRLQGHFESANPEFIKLLNAGPAGQPRLISRTAFLHSFRDAMRRSGISSDPKTRSEQLDIARQVGAYLGNEPVSSRQAFFKHGWSLLMSNPAVMAALVCGMGHGKYLELPDVDLPSLETILAALNRSQDADILELFRSFLPLVTSSGASSASRASGASSSSSSSAEPSPSAGSPLDVPAQAPLVMDVTEGCLQTLLEHADPTFIQLLKAKLTPGSRRSSHRSLLAHFREAMRRSSVSSDPVIRSAQLDIVQQFGAYLSHAGRSSRARFFRTNHGQKLLMARPAFMAALACGIGREKYDEVRNPAKPTAERANLPSFDQIFAALNRPEDADIREVFRATFFPAGEPGSSSPSSPSSSGSPDFSGSSEPALVEEPARAGPDAIQLDVPMAMNHEQPLSAHLQSLTDQLKIQTEREAALTLRLAESTLIFQLLENRLQQRDDSAPGIDEPEAQSMMELEASRVVRLSAEHLITQAAMKDLEDRIRAGEPHALPT